MHKSEIKRLTSMRDYAKQKANSAKDMLAQTPANNVLATDFWRKQLIGHLNVVESLNRQLGKYT